MSKDIWGNVFVEDIIRFRGPPHVVERRIQQTARQDFIDYGSVRIVLEKDPAQAGKFEAHHYLTHTLADGESRAARTAEARRAPIYAPTPAAAVDRGSRVGHPSVVTRTTVLSTMFAVVMLSGCGDPLESEECKAYFAKVKECVANAPPIKADVLKKTAETSKAAWKKNTNHTAVKKSCQTILETLEQDPDCK